MGLFYKDTVGYLNEFYPTGDNTDLNKRHEFGNLSKNTFLQGRMHVNQVGLLLKELPLKLPFHQQKSNFTLLSAPENPTFQQQKSNFTLLSAPENPTFRVLFWDAMFCLRKIQLSLHKFQSIQQRLEKSPPYIQSITLKSRHEQMLKCSLYWTGEMLYLAKNSAKFLQRLPKTRHWLVFYAKNSFLFKHNRVTSVDG